MDTHIDIPLALINAEALPRDRTALDPEALAELQLSIFTAGLRQPIEVWHLSTANGPTDYGLISGYRRLAAHKALGLPTIPAFIRTPATIADAMAAMVMENEVRADISPWERARLPLIAVSEGLFETPDAAIRALHPFATPVQKSRLRALVTVVEDLDETLIAPETLSMRQLLRLATALRAGFLDLITATIRTCPLKTPEATWSALQTTLDEAEDSLRNPPPYTRPGRPRRLLHPRPGLMVRRERTQHGWTLHFTGEDAHGMMIDGVMDEIERLIGVG